MVALYCHYLSLIYPEKSRKICAKLYHESNLTKLVC